MRGAFLGVAFALVSVVSAQAQLIRPNSATATSEFSGSYLATNTVNGSGLPANFTLTDSHATYTTGNHWTTQANHTLGESITWTFNTAQSLGGIHLWNHRSNGIAANSNYEITLYDLVFFDNVNGTGNTLATVTNETLLPDLAVAQTKPFNITANVRSVRLIVRATQNGNVSPYTGLGEVAFASCIAVGAGPDLASTPLCINGTASFTANPTGSGPFTYQWQWRPEGQATWNPVTNGVNNDPLSGQPDFVATDANSNSVGVSQPASGGRREFQVLITNQCGNATSTIAVLDVNSCDCIDFNNDGSAFDPQDIDAFLSVYAEGPCIPAEAFCNDIDFNNDTSVFDPCDIDSFLLVFSEGPCTLCGE